MCNSAQYELADGAAGAPALRQAFRHAQERVAGAPRSGLAAEARKPATPRVILSVLATLVLAACGCRTTRGLDAHVFERLDGAWRNSATQQIIHVQGGLVHFYETTLQNRQLVRVRILDASGDAVTVRFLGLIETWTVIPSGEDLLVNRGCGETRFHRLAEVPPEMVQVPFDISSERSPVTEEEVMQVADEMSRRLAKDQELRKSGATTERIREVDASNREYLVETLRKHGWIDAERFGASASCTAAIFVNHIADLSLETAVGPFLEREMAGASDVSECYMVVLDKQRLQMGDRQLYGSQVCRDRRKDAVVCALEEPTLVNARRTAAGAQALEEYLATYSKFLYQGRPIMIPTVDAVADSCSQPPVR